MYLKLTMLIRNVWFQCANKEEIVFYAATHDFLAVSSSFLSLCSVNLHWNCNLLVSTSNFPWHLLVVGFALLFDLSMGLTAMMQPVIRTTNWMCGVIFNQHWAINVDERSQAISYWMHYYLLLHLITNLCNPYNALKKGVKVLYRT